MVIAAEPPTVLEAKEPLDPDPDPDGRRSLGILIDAVEEYAIIGLDPDGIVRSWNVGAHRIKGYTAPEILGRHFAAFYTVDDVRTGRPAQELLDARRQGSWRGEGWRVRKDGSQFWANVVITAVFDEQGRVEGFAKVTRDDTDRKKTEESIRQLDLLLERDRIALALHDAVVHRIFQAGFALDGLLPLMTDADSVDRIRKVAGILDDTLTQIRRVVNELSESAILSAELPR